MPVLLLEEVLLVAAALALLEEGCGSDLAGCVGLGSTLGVGWGVGLRSGVVGSGLGVFLGAAVGAGAGAGSGAALGCVVGRGARSTICTGMTTGSAGGAEW